MSLSLITFIPLAVGLLILLVPQKNATVIRWMAILATAFQLFLAFSIYQNFDKSKAGINQADSYQFVENHEWINVSLGSYGKLEINYTMGIDGLSVTMLILTAIISLIGVISSWKIDKHIKGYFFCFLLLDAAMMGVFSALDFFLFYLFWEMMLIPMYFLIGIWGGPRREYAAIKFFLYTLAGSLFMLLVMIALYFSYVSNPGAPSNELVHSFNMITMMNPANLLPGSLMSFESWRMTAFVLLFIGFAIKIPMFPFHTWLPDAHVEAPTPISVVLAGVLLKMGTYGLLRIAYPIFPDAVLNFSWYIGLFGVINIIYGALAAMGQTDLKKMIAYSSISHMGFVLLGMASLSTEGMSGAVLVMFSHGLISGMLFLAVGVVYDRAHHREIDGFGGLAKQMPVYTAITLFAFMASLGLPLMSGFIGEALVFMGAFSTPLTQNLSIVATLGIILTAVYYLWTYQRVFTGELNPKYIGMEEVNGRELLMLIPLGILVLLVGIYPSIYTDLITTSLNHLNDFIKSSGSVVVQL